jgi:hypothetical protein
LAKTRHIFQKQQTRKSEIPKEKVVRLRRATIFTRKTAKIKHPWTKNQKCNPCVGESKMSKNFVF